MIDMATWKERTIDVVRDVLLDPHNVRLGLPVDAPQPQIINDLFHNEKVLPLVEAIANLGYLTHEIPIVIQRSGDLVVVEGNRRLAALKAIQNPNLAPEFTARIRKLAESIPNRESLKKIRVKVAPSQDEADQLIAALHTSNPRVPWTPARQAAFFEAQVSAGRSLQELTALYPTVNVREFVIRAAVLGLFRNVEYKDPRLADALSDDRRLPVSTLERLYEYDEFQKLIGLKIDAETGTAKVVGTKKRFNALAEKVIADIVNKKQNTRTLNRTDSTTYREYMQDLRSFAASLSSTAAGQRLSVSTATNRNGASQGGGSMTAANTATGGQTAGTAIGDEAERETTKPSHRRRPRISAFLDTNELSVPPSMAKPIGVILQEIRELSVEKFPNAALDLLRTFLEKTIKAYAQTLGIDIRKEVKTQNFVQLDHCLQWVEKKATSEHNRSIAQVIRKVRGGQLAVYVATADHLNAINHNHLVSAEPDEVRTAWSAVKPLLEWMLKP